jgi:phage terminase small subunit
VAKPTARQAAFCERLITGLSATEAARQAGYSPHYANREAAKLVDKPQVAAYLADLRARVAERAIVTAEDVLRGLKHEAETAESDTARVAAWAHLGKHLSLFTEKSEITIRKDPSAMTDEELEQALRHAGLN